MRIIQFIPGAIASPAAITIPTSAPDIDAVVAAEIERLPSAMTIPDHAAHGHVIPADTSGTTVVAEILNGILGAGAGGAVQDFAAMVHGANVGADPVVAANPTRLTARTISLNVNTVLGDLLTLAYLEVGERVLTS